MLPRPQDKEREPEHQQCWETGHQAQGSQCPSDLVPRHPLAVTQPWTTLLPEPQFPACEMGTLALNLDIVPGQEAKSMLSQAGVRR